MKKLLRLYLAFLAKIIIKTKKPFIIGITGSAGKTTISSFVVQYLQNEFSEKNVEFSHYHYNGEFGLPLTIIGAKTGGRNPIKWLGVFMVFLKKIFKKYPKFLILEYGIDTPNEMDFLLSIAIPDIAIISPILSNHIEQFGSETAYRNEKLKILKSKKILAHESLEKYIQNQENKVTFFGKNEKISKIFSKNIFTSERGLSSEIFFKNQKFSLEIPVFGEYQIENILPIFAIADELQKNPENIVKFSQNFHTEAGRSSILKGKNNSIIIDGTYNGGLLSMIEGIKSTANIAKNRKILLFLGDMRELGNLEKTAHETLANEIIQIFQNQKNIEIFLVGRVMREIIFPILQKNFGEKNIESFLSSRKAGEKIGEKIQNSSEKYLIFAKGSQNTIFLEEGLKKFLEKTEIQKLCRQGSDWQAKKEKFFQSVE